MSLPAQFEGAVRAAVTDPIMQKRYRAGISANALGALIASKICDDNLEVFVELPVDKLYGKAKDRGQEECEIPVVLGTTRRQYIHVALVDKATGTLYTLTLWPVNMQLIMDDALCIRATKHEDYADAIEDLVENGFNGRGRASGRIPDNYIMQLFDKRMSYMIRRGSKKTCVSLPEFARALHKNFGLKNTQTMEAWRSYYPFNRVFETTRITTVVYTTMAYVNRAEIYVAYTDRTEIAAPDDTFVDTSAGEPVPEPAPEPAPEPVPEPVSVPATYVDTPSGRIEITPNLLRAIASAMEQKGAPPS